MNDKLAAEICRRLGGHNFAEISPLDPLFGAQCTTCGQNRPWDYCDKCKAPIIIGVHGAIEGLCGVHKWYRMVQFNDEGPIIRKTVGRGES